MDLLAPVNSNAGTSGSSVPFRRLPGGTGQTPETVPVAFLGRTSTLALQDPTLSLPRQVRNSKAKLPPGWVISAYFWDIESGGLDIDQRGHGTAHEQFTDIGIPRDGGLADLLTEARGPAPRFAAVICEDIERSGRDTFYALKLEKELTQAGIPLFAADEPIDVAGTNATTILVRRVKQGVAEWYRLQIKEKGWAGLREHSLQGFNIGKTPYGFLADKIPHPVPAKRAEGRTKTRLALDPDRAPVVEQIFIWRVTHRLSYGEIVAKLNADPRRYPPPPKAGRWTKLTVTNIAANPKYTGYMVFNRANSAGRANPPDQWLWSPKPTHPAIISREVWEQAQEITGLARSRAGHGPNSHRQTTRSYLLRRFIRCAICGRRYKGVMRGRQRLAYYVCPLDISDPRNAQRFPAHPKTALISETPLLDAIGEFFTTRIFGPDRAAHLAAVTPAADAHADTERQAQRAALQRQLADLDRRKTALADELEDTPTGMDPAAAAAWREDIRARFAKLHKKHADATAALADLDNPAQPASDPALLDLLPIGYREITAAAEPIQRRLYDAFDLQITYNRPTHTATLQATITDTTPDALSAITPPTTSPDSTGRPIPPPPASVSHLGSIPMSPAEGPRGSCSPRAGCLAWRQQWSLAGDAVAAAIR